MMTGSDAWELRWIARDLPALYDASVTSTSLEPAFRVVYEHDVYLLAGSDLINLKIRHRQNTLKLKRLYERTDEGFERWRTEFEAPLPAGDQLFRVALDLIGRAGPADRLGAAASAGEAVRILDTICDPRQMVAMHKVRHLFEEGICSVDDVRFRAGDGNYRSLGVESSSLSELRTLVQNLSLGRLGSPCNYAQFLVW
jgi:hypothetical protein